MNVRSFGPILRTMAEIERFTGRDENTIKRWTAEDGFPAQLLDGRWQAVVEDVLTWYRGRRPAEKNDYPKQGAIGSKRP